MQNSGAKRAAGMRCHIPSNVMPREGGASSTPRLLGSCCVVSAIPDRPVPATPKDSPDSDRCGRRSVCEDGKPGYDGECGLSD